MKIVTAVALLAVLTGCGDDDTSESAAPVAPGATQTPSPSVHPSPTPSPSYVENETCRTSMRPLVDVMLASNEDSLDFNTFDSRVDQLTKEIDAALAPCSNKVIGPARRTIYKYTLARAQWQVCDADACTAEVVDNIQAGLKLARRVDYQLDLTA